MGDDLYHKKDLEEMLAYDLAIMGHAVTDPSLFGMIKDDGHGLMLDVIEKPQTSRHKLANVGVYMLNRDFFEYELVPVGNGEFGLPQTLAAMAAQHKIKIHKARAWHPIGSQEDLKRAEELIQTFL